MAVVINFPFIYIAIIIAWILLIVGYYFESYAITMLASFFLILIGIDIVVSGIEDMTNLAIDGLGVIHMAIGGYIGISKGIEFIKE